MGLRAKSKQKKDLQRMTTYQQANSIEFCKARRFCFLNSEYDPENQENIFIGDADDLKLHVEAVVPNFDASEIPDCPRGLVLSDNHGCGAFQTEIPYRGSIDKFRLAMRQEAYESKGAL
jgi:hypothetical protein